VFVFEENPTLRRFISRFYFQAEELWEQEAAFCSVERPPRGCCSEVLTREAYIPRKSEAVLFCTRKPQDWTALTAS